MPKSDKTSSEPFKSWGVFKNPIDYPDGYVARLFHGETPTETCVMSTDYQVIEGHMLELGLYRLNRMPDDQPQILEVWI